MRLSALVCALALAACTSDAPPLDSEAISASYPEGPLWQGDKLYFTEMGADRVNVVENRVARTFFFQRGCGPTAIAPYGEGFLVLCHVGARVVWVNDDGHAIRSWGADENGVRLRDPNDVAADGRGGVFFSDPGLFARESRPHGYLMHLSAEGVLRRAAGPLWYPNGVYVDASHHTLYLTEHLAGRVLRYSFGDDGELGAPQTFVDLATVQRPLRYNTPYAETGPDGLEIGPNGDLFVAIYGEGHILRFSPDARLVDTIELPTRYVTNISFDSAGGAVTTGTFQNLEPPYPGEVRFHAASTFRRRPG